jgi:hypothetical protein
MANTKVTDLTANASPALEDLIYSIDDPSGTPASRKVTLTAVDGLIRSNNSLYVATANKTVAATTSETSLIGTGSGSLTLAAGLFTVGKVIHIRLMGVISDSGTPTLTVKLKLGSTVVASTGAATLPADITSKQFVADFWAVCRTTGGSGTVFGHGEARADTTVLPVVSTAAATVDTTGTLALDVTAQWSSGVAGNTMTVSFVLLERIN